MTIPTYEQMLRPILAIAASLTATVNGSVIYASAVDFSRQ